jgi:hypothetical protein
MFGSSPIEVLAREAMRARLVYCESFTLTARFLAGTPTALAANNSQTIPVIVDQAFDFVIQQKLGIWYNADTTTLNAAPNALAEFQMDTSAKPLSSAPMHWLNVYGAFTANKIPNSLPMPELISQKSTYQVKLTNLTADAPARVEISLPGFKVYYLSKNGRTPTREDIFGRQF